MAKRLADELTSDDQELTLEELETDMSTYIDMQDYISRQLDTSEKETERIIERAFEIAKSEQ